MELLSFHFRVFSWSFDEKIEFSSNSSVNYIFCRPIRCNKTYIANQGVCRPACMHILLQLHVSIKFWYIPIWYARVHFLYGGGGWVGWWCEGQYFVCRGEGGAAGWWWMGPRPHGPLRVISLSEFKKFDFSKMCPDPLTLNVRMKCLKC